MRILLLGAFCGLAAVSALGQVQVSVDFDELQYLPDQSLMAKVHITNFSGQTLTLGQDDHWLSFLIVRTDTRSMVDQFNPPPVRGMFKLPTSDVATKRVDLARSFDISQPGNYSVIVSVEIPQLQATLQSQPASFTIANGTELWALDFGAPAPAGTTHRAPEFRRYALLQANQGRQLKLYFRLSNPDETVTYRIYPLGPMLTFGNPERQVDGLSRLHLLYQDGARRFRYFIINPDGDLVVRQTYEYSNTRPRLALDDRGQIQVSGGVRVPSSTDLPRPAAAPDSVPDANPPKP